MKVSPPLEYRILVIDDDTAIHNDFLKIFSKQDTSNGELQELESALFGSEIRTPTPSRFEIDCASQGREGLEMVKRALSEHRPYAIAFVDGRMPPGWNGIETIHHLWQASSDLQTVLCTAYADYALHEIHRTLGESDNLLILKKPFDSVEVLQLAHTLTRKWQLNREARVRISVLDHMVREKNEEKNRTRALLDAALEHSPEGIIITDANGVKILWANQAASDIFGLSLSTPDYVSTMIQKGNVLMLQPDGTPYSPGESPSLQALRKGETIRGIETLCRDAQGREKWISSTSAPIRNADGKIIAGIIIFRDISNRKQTEKELFESKKNLWAFLDALPETAFLMDESGKILLGNKAFAQKIGKNIQSVVGLNVYDLIWRESAESNWNQRIRQVIESRKSANFEETNGGTITNNYIYPIVSDRKKGMRLAVLCFDTTHKKMMEKRLMHTDKLESMGLLISSISHEINNPNNFIIFNMPILKRYIDTIIPFAEAYAGEHPDAEFSGMKYSEFNADIFELIDNIEYGAQRIDRIISSLRDFSIKKDRAEYAEIRCEKIVERVLLLCRPELDKKVRDFHKDIAGDLPAIRTDSNALEQILVNLLINASRAVDKEASWISLKVSPASNTPYPGGWLVEVSDNGCGMSEEILKKIFDPFFTTSKQDVGTGLGLYITHMLVTGLGGHIEVESTLGTGTVFRIIIPDNDEQITDPGKGV